MSTSEANTAQRAFNWVRWAVRIGGLLILLVYVAQFFAKPGVIAEGEPAPTFAAELSDGTTLDLAEGLAQPLVLSFWASWCEPCKREAPILNAAHEDGVQVVGVNMDDLSKDAAQEAAAEMGMGFPILAGRSDVARRFKVQAVPTTYVIAPDGTITLAHSGVLTTEAFREAVKAARD